VKYRRKVFVNDAVVDLLMTKTGKMAEMFIVDILVVECYKDHFQLLF
jgi:REP element-mobilizing transposase RayT